MPAIVRVTVHHNEAGFAASDEEILILPVILENLAEDAFIPWIGGPGERFNVLGAPGGEELFHL